jgi:hypothetical protein
MAIMTDGHGAPVLPAQAIYEYNRHQGDWLPLRQSEDPS